MSEEPENGVISDSSERLPAGRSRAREWLRDGLFIIGLVGIYLVMMLFVLPRLGYET